MKVETSPSSMLSLRNEAMYTLRLLARIESLYVVLRRSGLREALGEASVLDGNDHLAELLEQMRKTEQELDWELTGEIVRLKDRIRDRAAEYARLRYGFGPGGHIRLPGALPGVPDKLKVNEISFVDDPVYELHVKGNPMRTDGGVLRQEVELLVGPDGVKVRAAEALKRDRLRSQMDG